MEVEIEKVNLAVEATHYECLCLWEKTKQFVVWKDVMAGKLITIDYIGNRPVCVELFWNIINGHKVLFYYGCSQLVDHEMIENWIIKNALNPGYTKTNPINFHLILEHCK